jgi:hypothetical protein
LYSTTTTFNTTKATNVDFVVWRGGAGVYDTTDDLGAGYVFEQAISPTSPSTIPSARIRFNTQNASTVTQIYIHQNDDAGNNHLNAWNFILGHVNGGNKARIVVAEDTSSPYENRSWRITAMSYSSSGNYFTLTVDSTFAPDDNIQGAGSYTNLDNLMGADTKVSVWAWRDDNANYSTTTTTTYNTSTLKTVSTSRSTLLQNTTKSTSRSTTTIFNTSTTTAFNTSRITQWYTVYNTTTTYNTSTTTVEFHNTTTFYNTSRITSTSSGGGCARGCI